MESICNLEWCKVPFPHYHLRDKCVKLNEVKKGISVCCLSELHIETGGFQEINIACKKCGNGLSGGGVIIKTDLC